MKYLRLVLSNLLRNKIRTVLTMGSVTVALFLFCSLNGVLDTLEDAIQVGSETRLVTRNAISLIFPMPTAYLDRISTVEGVQSVSVSNWFGGSDPNDPRGFFANFAVDAKTYFPMYTSDIDIIEGDAAPAGTPVAAGIDPKLAAFMNEQTGAVVGETLMKKKGWKMGQTITMAGTIYPGDWPVTIRAVFRAKNKSFGEEILFMHWKYLYERSNQQASAGTFILQLADPSRAGDIGKQVDSLFENSQAATRTETERAFQAGFVSMYGNLPFVIKVIGLAVVFAILLVASNSMMMAFRERTTEIGVLKTLGFTDQAVFGMVLAEAAFVTLGGGLLGSLGAKYLIESNGFNAGGLLPPMSVHLETVATGVGIALLLGAISGLIPAIRASRLQIVAALRRL